MLGKVVETPGVMDAWPDQNEGIMTSIWNVKENLLTPDGTNQ